MESPIALDLEEVDLVDIEAIRFLNAHVDERHLGVALLALYPGVDVLGQRQEEKARTDWR